MIRTRTGGMLSLVYKPLCVFLVILGLFGLVRLRSAVLATNYDIRNLEEKKTEVLNDTKLLLAERSKYASLEKIAASFSETSGKSGLTTAGENLFGNRVRVIHIRKSTGPQPYKASLKTEEANTVKGGRR